MARIARCRRGRAVARLPARRVRAPLLRQPLRRSEALLRRREEAARDRGRDPLRGHRSRDRRPLRRVQRRHPHRPRPRGHDPLPRGQRRARRPSRSRRWTTPPRSAWCRPERTARWSASSRSRPATSRRRTGSTRASTSWSPASCIASRPGSTSRSSARRSPGWSRRAACCTRSPAAATGSTSARPRSTSRPTPTASPVGSASLPAPGAVEGPDGHLAAGGSRRSTPMRCCRLRCCSARAPGSTAGRRIAASVLGPGVLVGADARDRALGPAGGGRGLGADRGDRFGLGPDAILKPEGALTDLTLVGAETSIAAGTRISGGRVPPADKSRIDPNRPGGER